MMKIKTPKYKNMVLLTSVVFVLIILFEIMPGYYDLGSSLVSVIFQKVSGSNDRTDKTEKDVLW